MSEVFKAQMPVKGLYEVASSKRPDSTEVKHAEGV